MSNLTWKKRKQAIEEKTKTKHKHLRTKCEIANKIMNKAKIDWTTIKIESEAFCDAFGLDLEDLTELCLTLD